MKNYKEYDKSKKYLFYINNQLVDHQSNEANYCAAHCDYSKSLTIEFVEKEEERIERARVALKIVGLEKRENHMPNQMSGGQQQRVAIARAIVNDAPIILADEPTGNLDTKTSIEVMEFFVNLNEKHGKTIVLVTHEPDIAEYCKRVVKFKDGNIESDITKRL